MYNEDDEFGPPTLPIPSSPAPPLSFTFVRLGLVFGKLAILERSTAEPLQFVVPSEPMAAAELHRYAEKLAGWWDAHFRIVNSRARPESL